MGGRFSSSGLVILRSGNWFVTIQPKTPSPDYVAVRAAFDNLFATVCHVFGDITIEAKQEGLRLTSANAHCVDLEVYLRFMAHLGRLDASSGSGMVDIGLESIHVAHSFASREQVRHALRLLEQPGRLGHGDLVIDNTLLREGSIVPIDFEVEVSGVIPKWHDQFMFVSSLPLDVRMGVAAKHPICGFEDFFPHRPLPEYVLAECILFASQVRRRRASVSTAYVHYVFARRQKRFLR